MGDKYNQGIQGVQGYQGVQGPQGVGAKGDPGEQGIPGQQGRPGRSSSSVERKVAYILVSLGAVLGVWFVGHNASEDLKNQINDFGVKSCLAQRLPNSSSNKFNNFLDDQIQTQREAYAINVQAKEFKRSAANKRAIARYEADKLHIPTVKECNSPLLK